MSSDSNSERNSKNRSLRVKYLRFLFNTNSSSTPRWPAFTPPDGVPLLKLTEYVVWLLTPSGNIGNYKSAVNYISALAIWSQEVGFPHDIRGDLHNPAKCAAWATFTSRYQADVPALRVTAPKLPLQAGHIEAIALDCDVHCWIDLRDLALILLAFCCGIRIGHFSSKRRNMQRHVLLWGSLAIRTDLVAIWLHSTKTRPTGAADGTWTSTAVGARPTGAAILDPVRVLKAWHHTNFKGDALLPVFPSAVDNTLPITRTEFTTMLRRRLSRALRRLPSAPTDMSRYSGISLRHGFGSAMWGRIPGHRLAEALDHKPPPGLESTAHYGRDNTLSARAANTQYLPFGDTNIIGRRDDVG